MKDPDLFHPLDRPVELEGLIGIFATDLCESLLPRFSVETDQGAFTQGVDQLISDVPVAKSDRGVSRRIHAIAESPFGIHSAFWISEKDRSMLSDAVLQGAFCLAGVPGGTERILFRPGDTMPKPLLIPPAEGMFRWVAVFFGRLGRGVCKKGWMVQECQREDKKEAFGFQF